MLTNMRGLFLGVVVLGACYGQIVPLYEAQSDLTSGTLVAAGSIGVVALAGRAGPLWLEIHWQIQKNYLKKRKINLMCYSNCRVGDIVCPQEFKKVLLRDNNANSREVLRWFMWRFGLSREGKTWRGKRRYLIKLWRSYEDGEDYEFILKRIMVFLIC